MTKISEILSIVVGVIIIVFLTCLCLEMIYNIGDDYQIITLEYSEAIIVLWILLGVGVSLSVICIIVSKKRERKSTIILNSIFIVVYVLIIIFLLSCYISVDLSA